MLAPNCLPHIKGFLYWERLKLKISDPQRNHWTAHVANYPADDGLPFTPTKLNCFLNIYFYRTCIFESRRFSYHAELFFIRLCWIVTLKLPSTFIQNFKDSPVGNLSKTEEPAHKTGICSGTHSMSSNPIIDMHKNDKEKFRDLINNAIFFLLSRKLGHVNEVPNICSLKCS